MPPILTQTNRTWLLQSDPKAVDLLRGCFQILLRFQVHSVHIVKQLATSEHPGPIVEVSIFDFTKRARPTFEVWSSMLLPSAPTSTFPVLAVSHNIKITPHDSNLSWFSILYIITCPSFWNYKAKAPIGSYGGSTIWSLDSKMEASIPNAASSSFSTTTW